MIKVSLQSGMQCLIKYSSTDNKRSVWVLKRRKKSGTVNTYYKNFGGIDLFANYTKSFPNYADITEDWLISDAEIKHATISEVIYFKNIKEFKEKYPEEFI